MKKYLMLILIGLFLIPGISYAPVVWWGNKEVENEAHWTFAYEEIYTNAYVVTLKAVPSATGEESFPYGWIRHYIESDGYEWNPTGYWTYPFGHPREPYWSFGRMVMGGSPAGTYINFKWLHMGAQAYMGECECTLPEGGKSLASPPEGSTFDTF